MESGPESHKTIMCIFRWSMALWNIQILISRDNRNVWSSMIEDSTVRLMIKCVTHVPIPQNDTDAAGLLLAAELAVFHTVLVSSPLSISLISRSCSQPLSLAVDHLLSWVSKKLDKRSSYFTATHPNCFFCPTHSPKHKDSSFTVVNEEWIAANLYI